MTTDEAYAKLKAFQASLGYVDVQTFVWTKSVPSGPVVWKPYLTHRMMNRHDAACAAMRTNFCSMRIE